MTQHTIRGRLPASSPAGARTAPHRQAPVLLEAASRGRALLGSLGAATLADRLRRPRLFRGATLERPVDAREIATSRLVLRPHSLADAAEWHALQSDAAVVRHLSWPVRTASQSRAHLRTRTHRTRLWQADDLLALAIVEDGRLIGDVSLQLRSVTREVRSVEMGWIVSPSRARQGFATEASLAVARLAFDELDARLVTAVIAAANVRSIALARRLGFREAHRSGDELLYTLTASDFRSVLERNAQLRGLVGSA